MASCSEPMRSMSPQATASFPERTVPISVAISCVFIIIAFLSLIYPFVLAHLKQRKAAKKGEQA